MTLFVTLFCFRTQANPWWKTDLQDTFPVKEIIVYNRADCCASELLFHGQIIRVLFYQTYFKIQN